MALPTAAENDMLDADMWNAVEGALITLQAPPSYHVAFPPSDAPKTTASATFTALVPSLFQSWTAGRYLVTLSLRCTSTAARFTFYVDTGGGLTNICDSGSTGGDGLGCPVGGVVEIARIIDYAGGMLSGFAAYWRATSGTVTADTGGGVIQFSCVKIADL